jgi:hypothetical protein
MATAKVFTESVSFGFGFGLDLSLILSLKSDIYYS